MSSRTDEYVPDILVVDTDAAVRLFMSTFLRQAGYRVTATASFHEARHHCEVACPALLIADIQIGEFNGLHLAWHRHLHDPGLPTLITHATRDRALEAEAKKLGAPYLVKPVPPREMVDTVSKLLEMSHIRVPMAGSPGGEVAISHS